MDLFLKIVNEFNLGNILEEPSRVSGGLTHKIYKLVTSKGKYVIKLLNPNIMKRPSALSNFNKADNLEEILQLHNIEAIYSLKFNNSKIQKIDNQYFYIYEWYNGKALKDHQIEEIHSIKISSLLATIHNIKQKEESYHDDILNIDFNYYLKEAKIMNSPIVSLLQDNIAILNEMIIKRNDSISKLPSIITICHNDMDCKNVLWINDEYKLIDLECLDYSSPYIELLELALCWSGLDSCNINFNLFKIFIKAYFSKSSINKHINWENVYYANLGRLNWLEYNIKRSLLIECSNKEEQELGIKEVNKTINQLIYYHKIKNDILRIIKDN